MPDETLEQDPWDERDAYLEEGHDDVEVDDELVVAADVGDEPDLSEHEEEA